ncbi:MAG: GEVED domain-containing protein [Chitinophagales bacterium]
MKKQFLLAVVFLVTTLNTFADFSVDWTSTAKNLLSNTGTAVARDAQDNVYTTTATGDIYFEKHDKFGNFKWQVHSFTTLQFNYEFPTKIFIDPQGNPIVVGYRYTSPTEGNPANSLIILKYDPNGNLIYKKNIDGDYSYFSSSQQSTYYTKINSYMDAQGNIYIGTAGGVDGYPDDGFTVVKVSPAGNILWVSTKTFISPTQFHFVTNMEVKGNRIGVTGVTSYPSANSTNWMLDTTGTSLWSDIQTGVSGIDVAFDNKGNSYFLTWVSVNSVGDMRVNKYNASGVLLYQKNYDFGGSEISARIDLAPDNTMVITGYGNKYPGGSLYVDWITFKIKLGGAKLWEKRYDQHTNNDEVPRFTAIDSDGDIFVTGIGGPYPGGSNLGDQQMVTVKYTSAGVEEWAYKTDTLNDYNTGVGIAIASDGSIFVVGNANTFLVHILDNTGGSPCTVPTGITATSVGEESATINWTPVPNAYLYHVQYKPSSSLTWLQISTNLTSTVLTDLSIGTTYNFRVEAICNSGPTGYSNTQQFTTLGAGYCVSKGLDASKEWIDLVYIGSLLNSTSSDGGYGNYTNLSVDLVKGSTYSMTLSAEINPFGAYEVWRVWIDFNHDNDFDDTGEKVVAYKSQQIGWESHNVTVPANAVTGPTRMRVSLKKSSPQTPCEIFSLGEVEDYTVNILPPKNGELPLTSGVESNISPALNFAPNPTAAASQISFAGMNGEVTIHVFDLAGKLMEEKIADATSSFTLDTHSWKSGLYFVRATDEHGNAAVGKLIRQ